MNSGKAMGLLARVPGMALLIGLAGCMEGRDAAPSANGLYGDADALAAPDLGARNGRAAALPMAMGAQPTQVVFFDDTVSPQAAPTGVRPSGQGYRVNLQAVPIDVAAKSLLDDTLGLSQTIAPSVTGTLTLDTGGEVARADLLMIFEIALQADGLILVAEGSGFSIRALDGAGTTAAMAAEGYGFSAVPLRHMGAKRMLALLDGFAAPEGVIRASENDDFPLVRSSPPDRRNILAMVQSLDVGVLAKPSSGIAYLQNADAAQVAGDMGTLAQGDPEAGNWTLQVLRRSNGILVQAKNPAGLSRGSDGQGSWTARGGMAGTDVSIYQVQNAKASALAAVLQSTLRDGGSAAPEPPAPATGAAPAAPEAQAVAAVARTGGGAVRFAADDGANTVVIRASTPVRKQALQLLLALDKPPVQVLIDVVLVEVTLNDATSRGVQAYLTSQAGSLIAAKGTTTVIAASAPGFNLVLGNGVNPKLIIDDLAQVTKVKVLSAPSVSAFENEEATIKVVEQVPIVTQQVVSTQAGNAPVVNSVEYRDAGVILKVTPRVSQTDLVNLQVDQELSAVVQGNTGAASLTPTLRERSISTRVAVFDQQTVALGGLISQQDTAGKNRLFGFLTKHANSEKGRTELVVFITPHVVRNPAEAAAAGAVRMRARASGR